jgi:NAD(P)-dependent dehydrogenase (short-subunit alcohol dehydrogenase family)
VVGALTAMQAVIPLMREQGGGVIINISSGTTKMVIPNVGPYASTKAALNTLTLTARLELAPDNIRVGLVYPGITATDFIKHAASVRISNDRRQIMSMESPEGSTTE